MSLYYGALTVFSTAGLFFLYKMKIPSIAINTYKKYERAISFFRKKQGAGQITYGEKAALVYSFFALCFSVIYKSVVQYMYSNLRFNSSNKTYELDYIIEGTKYTLIINSTKSPCQILQIVNCDEDTDITDEIMPYLGQSNDWHGKVLTPDYFNLNSISFELANGKTVVYNSHNFMTINLEI